MTDTACLKNLLTYFKISNNGIKHEWILIASQLFLVFYNSGDQKLVYGETCITRTDLSALNDLALIRSSDP